MGRRGVSLFLTLAFAAAVAVPAVQGLYLLDAARIVEEQNAWIREKIQRTERTTGPLPQKLKRTIEAVIARKNVAEAIESEISPTAEAIAELSRLPRGVILSRIAIDGRRLTALGELGHEASAASILATVVRSSFLNDARVNEARGREAEHGSGPGAGRSFRLQARLPIMPELQRAKRTQ